MTAGSTSEEAESCNNFINAKSLGLIILVNIYLFLFNNG